MTVTTAQYDRLKQVQERTKNARGKRQQAQQAIDAAKAAGDQQVQRAAEVAFLQAQGEVDLSTELESVVLSQMAGVSGVAMGLGGESFLDDPDTIRSLEQLAHSTMPVGNLNLGPIAGRDDLVAQIESGQWGSPRRMAAGIGYTPTDPSLPDDTRLGPFYGVVPQLRRRLRLLDIVPTMAMEGLMFHYVIESGDLDSAWETAELSLKPQGDQVLADGTVEAKTIAAWSKLARQQLADVPTLSMVVQSRLTYSVLRRVENALVAGDGAGENLRGIMHTPGITVVNYVAEPLADLALAGIADILGANAQPDAVVLSPADWAAMLAAKAVGSGERLDSAGAFQTPADTLWGLPAIVSTVMPAGTALVGDFGLGCGLFVREGTNLRISDSDQDDFLRNRVTLLAEGRFGLAVWRPSAFAVVAFDSAGASGYGMRAPGAFQPPPPVVAGPPGATGPS
jgi:hypothetical protein